MCRYARSTLALAVLTALLLSLYPANGFGQSLSRASDVENPTSPVVSVSPASATEAEQSTSRASKFVDAVSGLTAEDLVRRAVASNAELSAARLDVERARARSRQAGLRPNPTIDVEYATGQPTGSAGEGGTSVGLSVPVDVSGRRARRVDLARLELEAAEAEVADRERRLASDVRTAYVEALAALAELEVTSDLGDIDLETTRQVEIRVGQGESAPLELNLLRAEVERLRARRMLLDGRLEASLLRLKALARMAPDEPIRFREDLVRSTSAGPLAPLASAVAVALRERPDVRLARIEEEAARAGLRLARAEAAPDVTAFAKYSTERSRFDETPVGPISDRDRVVSFGVSVGLPLFNRNQGSTAEAAVAVAQAERRREFAEAAVRAEVAGVYARYEAARSAVAHYEVDVLARSEQNLRAIQGAYQLGAYRLTELLAEQRRVVDSRLEYAEALAERSRALADLETAMGTATPDPAAPPPAPSAAPTTEPTVPRRPAPPAAPSAPTSSDTTGVRVEADPAAAPPKPTSPERKEGTSR